ncbi:proton-translocating NADH-quinone oxidoreductase, chain L [Parabacteroides sp. HGS0025]|uniref:NADH-quinone oxidoreductase subunit L n=1 Tax=Parabacteroides sp. HGS0025 TaxID=1078087 RepID=UPI0006172B26|nr:NADH-quinone oxidoreductase subunit L [Parabacteroides sp. HGS0025]KKB46584.1 proton-translocating NADH-quinone oxidoreductase, chain L [Parabacteroides sp. HGS0025]
MNNYELYTGSILLLPLAGFIILSLTGKRFAPRGAGILATVLLAFTTLLSWIVAYGYFFEFGKRSGIYQPCRLMDFQWLPFTDTLSINVGMTLTPIIAMMLIVISTVSLLVHLYSISYMKGEERPGSYFAYLQLFTFSMLGLVMAFNIFQVYFFWELVGVSSFLLIGFYFKLPAAIAAAKKAFIVTRFADLGFLIGILMLGAGAGSFDIEQIISRLTDPGSPYLTAFTSGSFLGFSTLTWALLLVFAGGAGKSAVFPLHVWLPDAMEGPTPVSALIHAATMVVAGVFLVARLFPVYAISAPAALEVIAILSAFTALFAAVIACTQTELKKVLAYSTISQIAYMLLALGVAGWGREAAEGYTASMFHLFTHAFFKAALFLCAGVIIHIVHSGKLEDMGGLRKRLPVTHIAFLLAALSISGFPFLSGFFSKEAILAAAWVHHPVLYTVALITSGLTAFYMFRIYFLVFFNKKATEEKAHEPWQMALPLIVLTIGSVFAGYIPFGELVSANELPFELHVSVQSSILPVSAALAGILVAALFYAVRNDRPAAFAKGLGHFYRWAYHKFYVDAIYLFFAKQVMDKGFGGLFSYIDTHVIQGGLSELADGTYSFSILIKRMQSGRIQTYAFFFLGGILLMAILLIIQYI